MTTKCTGLIKALCSKGIHAWERVSFFSFRFYGKTENIPFLKTARTVAAYRSLQVASPGDSICIRCGEISHDE